MIKPEEVKQVIVVRTDLNMRKGKIGAQCAHAAMKSLLAKIQAARSIGPYEPMAHFDAVELAWYFGNFRKIVVGVDSEAALLDIETRALVIGLRCYLITDNGLTEFHGVPTMTCLAIGPNLGSEIDVITGGLKLL